MRTYLLKSDPAFITSARENVTKAIAMSGNLLTAMEHPQSIEKVRSLELNAGQYLDQLGEFVRINERSENSQVEMERAAREAVGNLRTLQTELENVARNRIAQSGDEESVQALRLINLINNTVENILIARNHERNYVLRGDTKSLEQLRASVENTHKNINLLQQELRVENLKISLVNAQTEVENYEGQLTEFARINNDSENAQQILAREAKEAVKNANTSVELQLEQLQEETQLLKMIIIGTVLLSVILAGIVVVVISRQIVNPLNAILEVSEKVADGDLTVDIDSDRKDELGDITRATGGMVDKLKGLLINLTAGITQLATAAEELSAVTEQNKAGVETQRTETEQVATAVEQMTSTAQEIARSAEDTSATTNDSFIQAKSGDQLVKDTSDQIHRLTEEIQTSNQVIIGLKSESQNIETILDVIKEITEMTNLLALNAAIEAARAGEAGRGFAVVAQEVRTLAQRTQDSTSQIEGLIDSLQLKTDDAVVHMDKSQTLAEQTIEMAQDARESIDEITKAIENVQDRNHQVATAATEQSSVAAEINANVVNIRDVADETAAATNQTAAASLDLSRLSAELHNQTKQFRLDKAAAREAKDMARDAAVQSATAIVPDGLAVAPA